MAGQPTKYNTEIGIKICEQIACSSKSMSKICSELGVSYGTHLNWVRTNDEYLRLYKMAKEDQADFLSEEIIEIADDSSNDIEEFEMGDGIVSSRLNTEHIQRSRLRVDARKWVASKLKPKKYGDRMDLTSDNQPLPVPVIVMPKQTGE